MDKKSDVELRVSEAINALAILDTDLTSMEARVRDGDFTEDVKSELRQGHDYITLARLGAQRLLERMKPDPAKWLGSSENRDNGREAMRPIIKFCREALVCLATANLRAFGAMPDEWILRELWELIYDEHMGDVDHLVRAADRSFIVAGFQPATADRRFRGYAANRGPALLPPAPTR